MNIRSLFLSALLVILPFVFQIRAAEPATVTISNLETTYNGSPQGVTVETSPPGLEVEVKYDGSTDLPINAGNYAVTAMVINNPDYEGTAAANFEIKKIEVQLVIGNLQQTFNGRYLPVSISIAEGQSLPVNLLPSHLEVSYSWEAGSYQTVGYSRSEGATSYEMNYTPTGPNWESSPARTYAGNHTVEVSYNDGNIVCSGSATLVVAKGQLSDFLRVGIQAFDYAGYYGYYGYWPYIYNGVEINPDYNLISGLSIYVENYGSGASQSYSIDTNYYYNYSNDGWLQTALSPSAHDYNYNFPSLGATLTPYGGPIGGYSWDGSSYGYSYSFTISTLDSNLEGTIFVPFGIRQISFWAQVYASPHEFDGNHRSISIGSYNYGINNYGIIPQQLNVTCSWSNWSSYGYGSGVTYQYGGWQGDWGSSYYYPTGSDQPILPPGNWSFSVNPGGWDSYNFSGGGWGSVDISKKQTSFRIDPPTSENGTSENPTPEQIPLIQQTEGYASIPVVLSGSVIYDQYGRSILASAQSYPITSDPYSGYYYNSGTTPPAIRVVYQNSISGEETIVDYQVSSIPENHYSGAAMVADLVYNPTSSQPLPAGEYTIRVEIPDAGGLNDASRFGDGSNYFDYFQITNLSTPLATLIVGGSGPPTPPDTDGDGVNDYREAKDGTNPNDANSFDSLSKGLVAYYPLDGNANDESGQGNHGTNVGATPSVDRFFKEGKSYLFDGASKIDLPFAQGSVDQYTITAWFKTTEGGIILGANHQEPALLIGIAKEASGYGENTGRSFISLSANPGVWIGKLSSSKTKAPDGQWHQIVGVFSSTNGSIVEPQNFRLFIDGNEVDFINNTSGNPSGEFTSPISAQNLFAIGTHADGWESPGFNGNLDDIRIYNRALSDAEIAQLYINEFAPADTDGDGVNDYREAQDGTNPHDANSYDSISKGLVAFYPFNGNFNDESGNQNHLSNNGSILTNDRNDLPTSAIGLSPTTGALSQKKIPITGNSERTISLWVKVSQNPPTDHPPHASAEGSIIGWGKPCWDIGIAKYSGLIYVPYYSSNAFSAEQRYNLQFVGWYSDTTVLTSPSNLQGEWHHLVVVYKNDAAETRYYLNGTPQTTNFSISSDPHNTTQLDTIATELGINSESGKILGGWKGIEGSMDDIRIYDRAITAEEVAKLYSQESIYDDMVFVQGGVLPQDSGLAGAMAGDFEIGKFEVTWSEWQAVRDWGIENGYEDLLGVGVGSGLNFPVTTIGWYDAVKWCNAKSEKEGLNPVYSFNGGVYKTGEVSPIVDSMANGYRLPTVQEFEWAARGGVHSKGFTYSGSNDVDAVCWEASNSGFGVQPVGKKSHNELNIFDMSGNVMEWCEGLHSNAYRVLRGGSFTKTPDWCTVSFGGLAIYNSRNGDFGFRLARTSLGSIQPVTPALTNPPSASPILYGQALTNSTLTGGNATVDGVVVAGNFAFENPQTQPSVGNSTHSIVFTPDDTVNYTTATTSVTVAVLDPAADEDSDGLNNSDEYAAGTNPFVSDTDGDGFSDKVEIDADSNPLLSNSIPGWVDSDGDGVTDYREIADGTDPADYASFKILSRGLLIYYPFEGTLQDESGFRNDAVLAGGNLTSGRSDTYNSALQVGIQDGAKSLKNVGITGNSNFTVSFWMKPTLQPKFPEAFVIGWGAIPTQDGTVSHFYYRPYLNGANLDIDEGNVGARVQSHTSNLTGIWSHITYSYDSANRAFAIYRNGVLQTTNFQTYNMEMHNLGDSKLYLGGTTKTGDHPPDQYGGRGLAGILDDVRVYNRTLSESEIQQLYVAEAADATAPQISLEGENPMFVFKGAPFTDPGATVTDNADASWSISGNGTVDTTALGNYTLTYSASDLSGNMAAEVERTIGVILDPDGDEDGDGLKNSVETDTGTFVSVTDTGTNPLVADTNNDGFTDGEALEAGLNPLTDYSAVIALVKKLSADNPGRFDLYSTDAIMDLNLGALTIQKGGTTATVELQLQGTTNIATEPFSNLGPPVEFEVEMPGDKGFLRIHALGPK
jgi:sulfatase modifying factor 1